MWYLLTLYIRVESTRVGLHKICWLLKASIGLGDFTSCETKETYFYTDLIIKAFIILANFHLYHILLRNLKTNNYLLLQGIMLENGKESQIYLIYRIQDMVVLFFKYLCELYSVKKIMISIINLTHYLSFRLNYHCNHYRLAIA